VDSHAPTADGAGGHRVSFNQTVVILVVLVVLTAFEVAVAMWHGPSRLVTVLLFALAIAQAAYFALVTMGLRSETRTMKKLVAIPLGIAGFYALVLIADAVWRALGRVPL
jgi:heme/copper-type cytochrome/quinol oxidase subunit 4